MLSQIAREPSEIPGAESRGLRRTSLVVQRLRICLPTQATQVQSLVREDSTCLGATKPMYNY